MREFKPFEGVKFPRLHRVHIAATQEDTYTYYLSEFISPVEGPSGQPERWRYMPRAYRFDFMELYEDRVEKDYTLERELYLVQALYEVEGVEREVIQLGVNFFSLKHAAGVSTKEVHRGVLEAVASRLLDGYIVTFEVSFSNSWYDLTLEAAEHPISTLSV